jgi:predicted phage terminase large subunit-like protein
LYCVVAPTFGMLADATLRSFLALAEELGVVDAGEVKRSAPPSVRLRTGAEVLFRSTDEPDRLRGPNLSGVWMDEASLMPAEAFTVAIGRLREAGEQGWLSATFTPKGRLHWTFETFATGRPDTAIFYARTKENPFLPPRFHDTVRQQYTAAHAAQELEGEFTDAAGTLFKRYWFGVVDAPPPLRDRVRAWDLAATPRDEAQARDPDHTAGVLMGKAADGTHYVLDVRRLQGTPREVQALVRRTAEADGRGVRIWLEQEPGSAGATVVSHFFQLLSGFNFHAERSTGSKSDRARPLAAQAEGGTVKLARGPWNKDFLDEMEMFPFGPHDDQADAASLAFAKLALPDNSYYRDENLEAMIVRPAGGRRGDTPGFSAPAAPAVVPKPRPLPARGSPARSVQPLSRHATRGPRAGILTVPYGSQAGGSGGRGRFLVPRDQRTATGKGDRAKGMWAASRRPRGAAHHRHQAGRQGQSGQRLGKPRQVAEWFGGARRAAVAGLLPDIRRSHRPRAAAAVTHLLVRANPVVSFAIGFVVEYAIEPPLPEMQVTPWPAGQAHTGTRPISHGFAPSARAAASQNPTQTWGRRC